MNNVESILISLDEIEIIEWYDGIVRAIGKSQNSSYLIILDEWNIKESQRLYILLKLDSQTLSKLKSCFRDEQKKTKEEQWDTFTSIFEAFVEEYSGDFYLLSTYPMQKENLTVEATSNKAHLQKLKNYSIENTIR